MPIDNQKFDVYTLYSGKEIKFPQGTPKEEVLAEMDRLEPQAQASDGFPSLIDTVGDGSKSSEFSENPGMLDRFAASFASSAQDVLGGAIPTAKIAYAGATDNQELFDSANIDLAESSRKAALINPDQSSFQEVKDKYHKEGFFSAAGEMFGDLLPQVLGGSFGFVAPSALIAAPAMLTAAPLATAAGATAAGFTAAGFGTMVMGFLGDQLERDYANDNTQVEDINLVKHVGLAVGQAGLDLLTFKQMGLLNKLMRSAHANPASALNKSINKATFTTAEQIAQATFGKSALQVARVLGTESVTETGQLAFERMSAGEDVLPEDQEDYDEYMENFVGALLAGGAMGAGSAAVDYQRPRNKKKREDKALALNKEFQTHISERFQEDAVNKEAREKAGVRSQEKSRIAYGLELDKLGEELAAEAAEQDAELQAATTARAENELAGIRVGERTVEDIENVAADRNVLIAGTPQAKAGFNRLVYSVLGHANIAKATPAEIETIYNHIASRPQAADATTLPLTSASDALSIAEEIAKTDKSNTIVNRAGMIDRIGKILKSDKRGKEKVSSVFASKDTLKLRAHAVFNKMVETGLLHITQETTTTKPKAVRGPNGQFVKAAPSKTTKGPKLYTVDPATPKLFLDKDMRSLAETALAYARGNVRQMKEGKNTIDVIGEFPSLTQLTSVVGPVNAEAYAEIVKSLETRGLIKKKGKTKYVASSVPDEISNRREYTKTGVTAKRIVRDSNGEIVSILNNKAESDQFMADNADKGYSEPQLVKGIFIRETEFSDTEGQPSKPLRSTTVEYIEQGRGMNEDADAAVDNHRLKVLQKRAEFLNGPNAVADPELTRQARSSDPKERAIALGKIREQAYSKKRVVERYDLRLTEEEASKASEEALLGFAPLVKMALPINFIGDAAASTPVVVLKGTYKDGKGFGMARLNEVFPSWRVALEKVMHDVTQPDPFSNLGKLMKWNDRAGRTIVKDTSGDSNVYFVFDFIEDSEGNNQFHLYNVFSHDTDPGNTPYTASAENISKSSPLRSPNSTAEAVSAAMNLEHSSLKRMSAADRANEASGPARTQTQKLADNQTMIDADRFPPGVVGGFMKVLGWEGLPITKEWRERARVWSTDRYHSLRKDERRLFDQDTGKQLGHELSTTAAIEWHQRASQIFGAALDVGIVSVRRIIGMDGTWNGANSLTVEDFVTENQTGEMVGYDVATGEYTNHTYAQELYTEARRNIRGGLFGILSGEHKKGKVFDDMVRYLRALRAKGMLDADPEAIVPHTQDQINAGLSIINNNANVAVMAHNFIQWNNKMLRNAVEAGVLSEAEYEAWTARNDYMNFYTNASKAAGEPTNPRERMTGFIDDDPSVTTAPQEGGPGLTKKQASKKYKGVGKTKADGTAFDIEKDFTDAVEGISANHMQILSASLANIARQRAVRDGLSLGTAFPMDQYTALQQRAYANQRVTIFENGVEVAYRVTDPLMFAAMSSKNWGGNDIADKIRNSAFGHILTRPSHWLRETVTRNPSFSYSNLLRDSGVVWLVNGGHPELITNAIREAVSGTITDSHMLRGTNHTASDTYRLLYNNGIIGGYENVQVAGNAKKVAEGIHKKLAEDPSGNEGRFSVRGAWGELANVGMHSEAATRIGVYEHVHEKAKERLVAQGRYSDADVEILARNEAFYQAKEILNFSRKGSSDALAVLTSLAPFVNAKLQGADVIYRAMAGTMDVGYNTELTPNEITKAIMVRGAYIAAYASALALINYGDDEYEELSGHVRDNNFLAHIPGTAGAYISVPVPFELGWFFKTVPEQLVRSLAKNANGEGGEASTDWWRSVGEFAKSIADPAQLVPVAARPFMMMATGKTTSGGIPVESRWDENLPASEKIGSKTTAQSILAGKLTGIAGISPQELDQTVKELTGGLGAMFMASLDGVMRAAMPSMASRPSKGIAGLSSLPILDRMVVDSAQSRGGDQALYNFLGEMSGVSQLLSRASSSDERRAIREKYGPELRAARRMKGVGRGMSKVGKRERKVREDTSMSSRQMRLKLDDVDKKRDLYRERFRDIRKKYNKEME